MKIAKLLFIAVLIVAPLYSLMNKDKLDAYKTLVGFDTTMAQNFNLINPGYSYDRVSELLGEEDDVTTELDLANIEISRTVLELNKDIPVSSYYYWDNYKYVYIIGMSEEDTVRTKYVAKVINLEEETEESEE